MKISRRLFNSGMTAFTIGAIAEIKPSLARAADGNNRMFAASRCEFPSSLRDLKVKDVIAVSKIKFKNIGKAKRGIEVIYANFFLDPERGGIEVENDRTIRVRAFIEVNGISTIGVDNISRSNIVEIKPGKDGRLYWNNLILEQGQEYYIYTLVTGADGRLPASYQTNEDRLEAIGWTSQALFESLQELPDLKMQPSTGMYAFGPCAVGGEPTDGIRGPSGALICDSIGMGVAELRSMGSLTGQRGFIGRALETNRLDFSRFGMNGAKLHSFIGDNFSRRRNIFSNFTSFIIFQACNNDLGEKYATLVDLWSLMYSELMTVCPVISVGVLPGPKTQSSDKWLSIENQRVKASDQYSDRLTSGNVRFAFRNFINSQVSSRLSSIIDPVPFWSPADRIDLWLPRMTADGLHPSAFAHEEAVKAITPEVLSLLLSTKKWL